MKASKLIANWIEEQYVKYGENQTVALISKYLTPAIAQKILCFLINKGLNALCVYLAAQFPVLAILAGPVGTIISKVIATL